MDDGAQALQSVFERADVGRALALGEWSVVLRAVLDTGVSQTWIAGRTGISQGQVSRLASGAATAPTLETIRALCDGLGIPRRLAGLAEEDDTDRRQLLGATLGSVGLAALPSHAEVGDEQLMMLTSMTYRRLEQRTPAKLLVGPSTSHLSLVRQLTDRCADGQKPRMYSALSEAAGLAAWLFADLGDAAQARRCYRLSIGAAQRSGHQLLAIYMQASLGQYAAAAGEPGQGLRLIRDASARLPRSAPCRPRAWLTAVEGVALAHLHDRAGLKALDQADRYLEAAGDEEPVWPWVFPFDAPKVAAQRAVAAARLGLPKLAAEAFAQAAVSHSPKQQALVTIERARAHAAAGDLDEACRLAVSAHRVATTYRSERVRQAVSSFRSELGPKPGTVTADLDEVLHSAYLEDA